MIRLGSFLLLFLGCTVVAGGKQLDEPSGPHPQQRQAGADDALDAEARWFGC